MARNRISDDARQVVFNVLLYFEQEADRFKKQENGYFQRVHARVTKACCVSRKFINTILKEEPFYRKYSPQPVGKGRRIMCPEQEFGPSRLAAPRPTVIKMSPTPVPEPFVSPLFTPTVSFYSTLVPPPLVPIEKRTENLRTESPRIGSPLIEPPKPDVKDLDELLPPIINSLDTLLPPIINNLSEQPSLDPLAMSSQDQPLLDNSSDDSPYRSTPELFIDEDRVINYSDNDDTDRIDPILYDPIGLGFSEEMIRGFNNSGDGEIG